MKPARNYLLSGFTDILTGQIAIVSAQHRTFTSLSYAHITITSIEKAFAPCFPNYRIFSVMWCELNIVTQSAFNRS